MDGHVSIRWLWVAGVRWRRGGASSVPTNSTSCGPTLGRAHTTGKVRRPMWVDVRDDARFLLDTTFFNNRLWPQRKPALCFRFRETGCPHVETARSQCVPIAI